MTACVEQQRTWTVCCKCVGLAARAVAEASGCRAGAGGRGASEAQGAAREGLVGVRGDRKGRQGHLGASRVAVAEQPPSSDTPTGTS